MNYEFLVHKSFIQVIFSLFLILEASLEFASKVNTKAIYFDI
jgi:hypothetical protein